MNRKFIIATRRSTSAQQQAITGHLEMKKWAWWHHFEDFWMCSSWDKSTMTSQQLYEELANDAAIGKDLFMVVIKLQHGTEPMTYFGFGPKEGWEWAAQVWGHPG